LISFRISDSQVLPHYKSRNDSKEPVSIPTQPTSNGGTLQLPFMSTFNGAEHNLVGSDGSKINISSLLSFAKDKEVNNKPSLIKNMHCNSTESLPRVAPIQYQKSEEIKEFRPKSVERTSKRRNGIF